MKVNGLKINNTDLELKPGLMVLNMKEVIIWEENTVKENSYGLMDLLIPVNSKIIIFTVKEHIVGLTEENSLDNGKITKWTDMENSYGPMEENIAEII